MFGAGSVWALHAAVDWDWEMPATTAWIFALTGAGLAAPRAVDGWRDRTNLAPRIAAIVILVAVAIPSALLAASETQLSGSIEAVAVNDCPRAVAAAKKANSPLGLRAYGYEVEGYCAAARGRGVEAMEAMQKAVDVDPDNWEPHYGLAIVRAAAGMDPGPAARRAEQLNPREELVSEALEIASVQSPTERKRRAQEALLSLGPDGPALLLVDL